MGHPPPRRRGAPGSTTAYLSRELLLASAPYPVFAWDFAAFITIVNFLLAFYILQAKVLILWTPVNILVVKSVIEINNVIVQSIFKTKQIQL